MLNPETLVAALNTWPPELEAGIELVVCLLAMIGLLRWYG